MFSKHKVVLAILDTIVIVTGFNFGFWYVFHSGIYHAARPYPAYCLPSIMLAIIIFITVFQLSGLYKYQAIANPVHQIQSISQAFIKVLAAFILIIFFSKSEYFADSRLTIGFSFLVSFLLMILFRGIIVRNVYFYLIGNGKFQKRTLILGAGKQGQMVCRFLKLNPRSYFKVIGFCEVDANKKRKLVEGFPVLGTTKDLKTLIQKNNIHEIIIAIKTLHKGAMLDLIDQCKNLGLVVHVVSDLYREVNERMDAEEYGGLKTYRIRLRGNGIVRAFVKRAIDLVGSGILLVLLSPLFLIISIMIKRNSNGPIFYRSQVVGRRDRPFVAYKFRSMYSNEDSDLKAHGNNKADLVEEGVRKHNEFMKNFIQGNSNGDYYLRIDNRITNVGYFLRRFSLDELPQLINVFKGEMSLVGPRFCSLTEYSFYKPWHKKRFEVKPGMTGLWQVSARSSVSYDDMVFLDLYYIENRSLLFDFEILLRTIPVVFYGQGSRIEMRRDTSLEDKLEKLELVGRYGK